ncbi:exo-alpha-sialidase [Spirosoma sp. KCTC 42546]|uniref:WD40/YVTN/BNR-like repeat-containing protein n=1 Tax=Spirosoma sp. KCTC 42546 TaxID=2520506 RepID=UPI00115A3083|nr:exo-alpha-sialidase [Spirosoma sp. KCTC 42546]QDK78886.1 exo-alpha-sialidase [Spirosoma sp. KCTC 42546]
MDISSKYFAQFSRPNPYVLKYLWRFLLDIHRVGKLRELLSFVLWEISHRVRFYKFANQYVRFSSDHYLSLVDEANCLDENPILTSFFAKEGLCLQPVAIDWKYCFQVADGALWGCRYSHLNGLYCSKDESQSAVLVHVFAQPITSLFCSQQGVLFVCSNGTIYRSDDEGNSFTAVLQLSTPISYFLFNNGMTELPDHTLMIGEYGSLWHGKSWQNLAFLYYSSDGGITWDVSDFLKQQGVNKHIHLVKYCTRLKAVLLTDGDNKKQMWKNETLTHFDKQAKKQQHGWQLINKYHHQTGGYTSMAETNETVLFGSDYLGGTNFIVRTSDGKQFKKLVLPDPYRRSPVMNMVARQSLTGHEIWAASYSCLSGDAKSLLMCTKAAGKTWARVIEFDGTKHEVRLLNSSHNPSSMLYVSVTTFGDQENQHRIYKLDYKIPKGC